MKDDIDPQKPCWQNQRGLVTALVMSATLCSGYISQAAIAQPANTYNFNIKSQPLNRALRALSDQSGIQIAYQTSISTGANAPTIQGAMTTEQALARMLSGSGLRYSFTDANTVTIVSPSSSEVVNQSSSSVPVGAAGATMLETIHVTGRQGISAADAPFQTAGSSTYISGEKVNRFRGTSTGDMLSGVPGVLNADNRNGAALDVNIRGMQGQNRVPVLVDGAQQETTVWRGYSGISGRSYVDPDFISNVSIEKGPSAAADGTGAIGGVVRMNTITVDDILMPGENYGIRLKGGFNSNSSSKPSTGTSGGLTAGSFPNDSIPESMGDSARMNRPGLLEPTGFTGSVAAGFRSEYVDLVAAYARRKNGNYFAGTHGNGIPKQIIYPDCDYNAGPLGCVSPSPGQSLVEIEGLNRFRPGEEVLNTSQDNTSYLLKGTLRLPHDQQLDLGLMRYESKYGEIMPSQLIWRSQGAYQSWLNSVKMNTYTAKYKWNPADNDLINLKVNLWATDAELNTPFQWYIPSDSIPAEMQNGTINKRYGLNIENTSAFDTAYGGVSLSYGGSWTYETIKPTSYGDQSGRRGNRREVSLFASGEYKPTDWLTLNAALRYTHFKSNDKKWAFQQQIEHMYRNDENGKRTEISQEENDRLVKEWWAAGGSRSGRPYPVSSSYEILYAADPSQYESYDGAGFAPILSATVEPWKGIQFYGKYAQAIRQPSLFELARGFSTQDYLPGQGFGIRPERAKTWEFGVNFLRDDTFVNGDKLRAKINYFDNKVDDYLTRSVNNGDYSIVNIDRATLRGLELSASYDMGKFFGDLAYTRYLHTEFCTRPELVGGISATDRCYEGGTPNSYMVNQLPPRDSVSLTLGLRAFDEKLTAGSRLTYIGKRPTPTSGGTIAHADWEPYTVVDLFASYKVNEKLQIDAAIDNVADRYYMDALTLGLMPSPGRTFRMNVSMKF